MAGIKKSPSLDKFLFFGRVGFVIESEREKERERERERKKERDGKIRGKWVAEGGRATWSATPLPDRVVLIFSFFVCLL